MGHWSKCWDIGLKQVNGNIIYIKALNISDAYDFRHNVACLKMLMFEIFCFKFFNFVVVNFIISKNLKILKILGNKRPKNANLRQVKI